VSLERAIIDACRALGFHRAGIAPVEPAARHALYQGWLAAGHAGEMTYLAEPGAVDARRDPRALLDGARSVVCVALSYAGAGPGPIARYARGADYHTVLKGKLARLAAAVAGLARASTPRRSWSAISASAPPSASSARTPC
jgi:epoxyqueuosine reductase